MAFYKGPDLVSERGSESVSWARRVTRILNWVGIFVGDFFAYPTFFSVEKK